ncbi:MAG: shikimate kinase [Candidatus Hadarchaeia archaeon]
MRGKASACGSATIVNAIASGKGAAFAVDLRIYSEVELSEKEVGVTGEIEDSSEDPLLIECCVEKVLEHYGMEELGGVVRTSSELPTAVGLSSSSAAANATVLATASALDKDISPETAIELGVEASLDIGVTVTGAYDDASASFYGGAVVTDNDSMEILEKFSVDPSLSVLIYIPPEKSYTSDVDTERIELIGELVDSAHEEALSGNTFGALTLNGLLYSSVLDQDPDVALEALKAGAEAAGLTGTGPAVVALCEGEKVDKIKNRWKGKAGDIILTRPSSEGAIMEK